MPDTPPPEFLAGVIEGFYGPPWSRAERFEAFGWLGRFGLNTYFYGPKDDPHHRAIWRQPYSEPDAAALRELIAACQARGLRFVYALGPGLDVSYTRAADLAALQGRFAQLLDLGCRDFCLLFDDIPDRMDPADLAAFGSLPAAQAALANTVFRWTRERTAGRFLFCPTPYCGRMAASRLGGEGYLGILGRELLPDIDVFWTGPDIISREITVGHIAEVAALLRRPPVLWDNLHANDYDGRRFFCGPYSGRPPELRRVVRGILSNPNTEFPLNFTALHTLGAFTRCAGPWDPRAAHLAALRDWLPQFESLGRPLGFDDLAFFADCYYLPFEDGPEAESFYAQARALLSRDPASWGDEAAAFRRRLARLWQFCAHLAELRHRPLFHALSRRVWELREELDLLDRYVAFHTGTPHPGQPFRSDFHQPGTYRGGFVPRLQTLLRLSPDGSFSPGATLP